MHDSAQLPDSRCFGAKLRVTKKSSTLLEDPHARGPGFNGLHVVEATRVGADISEASVLTVQPPTLELDIFVSYRTSIAQWSKIR
jgi:hypothetical protein